MFLTRGTTVDERTQASTETFRGWSAAMLPALIALPLVGKLSAPLNRPSGTVVGEPTTWPV